MLAYSDPNKYKWNEYHKWKLKIRTFTPLTPSTVTRTPVSHTRGVWCSGHYNENKMTPFETFDVRVMASGYTTSLQQKY